MYYSRSDGCREASEHFPRNEQFGPCIHKMSGSSKALSKSSPEPSSRTWKNKRGGGGGGTTSLGPNVTYSCSSNDDSQHPNLSLLN